ncbi:syntaxin-binding protein 1-like [Biomphalaria glabrata]|uniref:Syntaxin-binding protein 1-like n=1 Tax=Biomphalaria glabrata TaxID=6526 RepID=A0A9W3BB84_BIOGL|nr:syntaxin-binding protein 1-like [Biomphalaria glabrata]
MVLKSLVREKILNEIVKQHKITGKGEWKVLILDTESTHIISACCKMKEITADGITLVEDLYKKREPLPLLEAIYFITPVEKSVHSLISDFKDRSSKLYKAAHVYFTEACPEDLFHTLCKAPVAKFIQTLKEINISFLPYESQVFSLDYPEVFQSLYKPENTSDQTHLLERCAEKIATLCVTLGEFPSVRFGLGFERNEALAKLVQQKLDSYKVDEPAMGEGPNKDRSLLLILERGFDPITPLLHELTLQAMAYDILPLPNDIYEYECQNGDETQIKEHILNESDDVWKELRHSHLAVFSQLVTKKLKEFAKSKQMDSPENTSVRDLSLMVKKAPQFQKDFNMYSAHFMLANQCMKKYQTYVEQLCKVEQDLALGTDVDGEKIKDHMKNIIPILLDEAITAYDKIRIILLYTIQKGGLSSENIQKLIEHASIPREMKSIITDIQKLGFPIIQDDKTPKPQQPYLPVNRKPQNLEDIYSTSRWVPYIQDLMEEGVNDRLTADKFPSVSGLTARQYNSGPRLSARLQDAGKKSNKALPHLIIFILGGMTYSEMRCAYHVTESSTNWEVIIGSTHILTPTKFLEDAQKLSTQQIIYEINSTVVTENEIDTTQNGSK